MATRSKLSKAHSRTIGLRALQRNLKKYGAQMSDELLKVQDSTGDRVREDAQNSLRNSSSRPGQPPAMQTGELAGSVVKVKTKKSTIHVGTKEKRGFFTEFGTKNMRARPWLYPALRRNKKHFESEVKQLHTRAMKGIDSGDSD